MIDRRSLRLTAGAFAAFAFLASFARSYAATEAYYRFESGAFLNDSSGKNRHLTNGGGATEVAVSGAMPTTVPQVGGAANGSMASLVGFGLLSSPDNDAYVSPEFTIEAFVRPGGTAGGTQIIASNFDSTTNNRGWYLGLNGGFLRILGSADGVASTIDQGLDQMVAGKDYYVGGAMRIGADIGPNGEDYMVKLYQRNLTDNGPLKVFTAYHAAPSVLWNPPAPFSIGSTGTSPNGTAPYAGMIDEVRFSTGVLGIPDLLGYNPSVPVVAPPSINGAASASTGEFTSMTVTINGDQITTYASSDLIGATLTGYTGSVAGGAPGPADVLWHAGATEGPAPAERLNLLGDNSIDSGLVNASGWTVTFAEAVLNRDGPDIVMVDFGSADAIDVTIGATTRAGTVATTTSAFQQYDNRTRWVSGVDPVTDLTGLTEAALTPATAPTTSGNANAHGIDLSDFGFSPGAMLTAGTPIVFSNGTTIDPVAVFGLRTPSTGLDGDFNDDMSVDGADLLVWQRGQSPNQNSPGDLAQWKANFGTGGVSAIPEPSGLVLTLLGCLMGKRRSRRV